MSETNPIGATCFDCPAILVEGDPKPLCSACNVYARVDAEAAAPRIQLTLAELAVLLAATGVRIVNTGRSYEVRRPNGRVETALTLRGAVGLVVGTMPPGSAAASRSPVAEA